VPVAGSTAATENRMKIAKPVFGLICLAILAGNIGILLALVSIILAIPIVMTFVETGLVPRLPTAVLSMGLMIMALLSISSGLVLDTVTRGRREMKMLAYLSQPALKRD
jgi:hypothetical protein